MIATGTVVSFTTLDAVLAELRSMRFEEHALRAEIEELKASETRVRALLDTWETTKCDWTKEADTIREDMIVGLRAAMEGSP